MTFIWATRGRSWGFRFLRSGGLTDPRPEYLRMFAGDEQNLEFYRRVGANVAVRFPDPEARVDSSGRVIPHEFVVFPPLSEQISSVEAALDVLWPEVRDVYDDVWNES